jgi:hypothetical protein
MPSTEQEWGERSFQVRDPNSVIIQLVDWNGQTKGWFITATTVVLSLAVKLTIGASITALSFTT